MYDEYLVTGKHEFTDNGNMKPVPRRPVARCIIEVWGEVKREMVADSFKGVAVTTKWDRSGDASGCTDEITPVSFRNGIHIRGSTESDEEEANDEEAFIDLEASDDEDIFVDLI